MVHVRVMLLRFTLAHGSHCIEQARVVHVWRMKPRMDLADASLIVAAETSGTRKVFTIDRKDCGNLRHFPVEIVS